MEKLHALQQNWSKLRFGKVKVKTDGMKHVFEVEVYLNTIDPNIYRTTVPATRRATDFTARIIPALSGVSVPLEATTILWQR